MISYHTNQPYENPKSHQRREFYDNPLLPTTVFDGTDHVFVESPPFNEIYEEHIRIAQSKAPYFNLTVEASASNSTGSVRVKIVAADTIPEDEMNAFVAILEDSLPGASNHSYTYYRVCRQLFQFPVNLIYPDSLDTTITFSHSIGVDRMRTVVFVQDMDTKEIMQSKGEKFLEE